MSVVIETTIGDITVDLYLKERSNTCMNFLKLCKIKYYNMCLFHKIERNFIAQSGDPTGTGRGGESVFCHLYGDQAKYFDSESKPRLKHEKLGTLSMVNNGNNMNGSQFFLTLGENLTYLDEDHTVFGEVAEGFDVLLKLNEAICDSNNRPYQDIRITHTVILHDPYDNPKGLIIPDASPEPTKEQLESNYIAVDEEIDDNKGKSTEEVEEKIKESEAKARATILEMVGDIPDVDVKPPENVLFVCKLNPVTSSEDLEIIFSRFGPIVSCEVIKDQKTGESLQYAFIEFEKEEDCENAYFKMDNVLIDDRRIHVDFSQSVSKMNWDKNSKMPRNKSSKQNVILRESSKGTVGYDLIFDMNEDCKNYEKDCKHRSKTLEHKLEHSSRHQNFDNRNRHHSQSPDIKKQKRNTDEREQASSYHHPSYSNSNSSRNYSDPDKICKYKERGSYSRDKREEYRQLPSENSKYSPERSSKRYRNSKHSKIYREYSKKSTDFFSKDHELAKYRHRHDSGSLCREGPKSEDRHKQKPSYSARSKIDYYEDQKRIKSKLDHRDSERSRETFFPKSKKHTSEKLTHDSKKCKRSKNLLKSSSTSSSSSSPEPNRKHSKFRKSSSSDSDTSSSNYSSAEKNKSKIYQKQKKKLPSDPHDKRKRHNRN